MGKANSSLIYLLVILLLVFNSCELIDPKESIPSYLRIENFEVFIPSNEKELYGTKSSKVIDAWIYVNDNLLGVFEVPTTVPILSTKGSSISIKPGIKKNGISSDRAIYPFYTSYQFQLSANPDSTQSVNPQISYQKNINLWKEDFDGVGISLFPKDNLSGKVSLTKDSSLIFHETDEKNLASGLFSFSDSTGKLEILSLPITLPNSSGPIFLELNYSTSNPLAIGAYLDDAQNGRKIYKMVLNPNQKNTAISPWNKVYVELTDVVAESISGKFSLFFESNKKEYVKGEEIFIDNIKLLSWGI